MYETKINVLNIIKNSKTEKKIVGRVIRGKKMLGTEVMMYPATHTRRHCWDELQLEMLGWGDRATVYLLVFWAIMAVSSIVHV